MKFKTLLGALSAALLIYTSHAVADKPKTEVEKFSYAIGYQIAQGFINQGFERDGLDVDTEALGAAIRDVLDGNELQLTVVEMRSVMAGIQQRVQAKRQEVANQAKADGDAFLAANKDKDGVVTLESGLQYKVLKSGSGKQPSAEDTITAHYKGTLIDGEVFDSSYQRGAPATFGVNQVIPGWTEILQLMHEGDKWQVYIPSELAYGERGAGQDIGPNETLIFDIELISVK